VAHTSLLEWMHWIAVVLVTPAVAVVLLASWRAHAARRDRRPDPKEIP
jgi:hypothetical protein